MGSLFQKLYFYFSSRRIMLAVIFIASFLMFGFLATKIHFKEDISSILPKDPKIDKLNQVFQDSKFMDKLVFIISTKDSSEDAVDTLVATADRVIPVIENSAKGYISKMDGRVDESVATGLFSIIQNHLPAFLNDADYDSIRVLISGDRVEQTVQNNLRILSSPAGMALKQFIAADPSGISFLGMKKLQQLQYDDNFELYDGYVVTRDHRHLLFFITPKYPPSNTGQNSKFISLLDASLHNLKEIPHINIHYFGATAVSVGNARQLRSDSLLTQGITVLFIMLFLGFYFRQKRAPFIIFIPVVYGAVFALAMVGLIKGSISVIALGTGSVILGIAVNYSLHLYNHFRHTRNMPETIAHLAQPMTIGSFTTIGGFFCLAFVKSEMLRDLGLFAGFCLIGASLASLIFLPHLMGKRIKDNREKENKGLINRIAELKPESNKWLVAAIFILTVFFAFWVHKAGFQTDLEEMNFMSPALKKSQQQLNEINRYSLQSIYLVTEGRTMDDALKHNERVNQELAGLQKQGVVIKESGVSSLIISDSLQRLRISKWEAFWTKERTDSFLNHIVSAGVKAGFREKAFMPLRELIERKYQPVDSASASSMKNAFLSDYISNKNGRHTVVTLVKVVSGKKDSVYHKFENNPYVTVLDRQYLSSRFVGLINADFSSIAWMTASLVFFVLLLMYGRIELTLISFIPMAISWVWILGIMGLFHIEFNIINIIISALIFGLGDDYSLFIMDGLLQEYKTGRKNLSSYKSSIILSAVTTIAGLGVLIFAQHPALKSIALISITGILCVVLMSQILIPFLFNLLITNRVKRGLYPWTFWGFFKSSFAFSYFIHWSIFFTVVGRLFAHLRVKERGKLLYHRMLWLATKSLVYIMVNVKKKIINGDKEDFSKPAVIICNHQSSLDIVALMMLHPKILMFTNRRKWNAPYFGPVIRMADYFPAEEIENHLDKMKERVNKGYSFLIFPEGTRSADGVIRRFHKGAFYLAEKLGVDILPILIHGNDYTLHKKDLLLKDGQLTVKILPRIIPDNPLFAGGYSTAAKYVGRYMREEFQKLREEMEVPRYFRNKLYYNFIYKGPVLEWYMRIKVKLEKDYSVFHNLIPKTAKVLDAGCGYGFMSYMLSFTGEGRDITGIDYDEEKIETAQRCFCRNERIRFAQADILQFEFEKYDSIIMADVLHYLPQDAQDQVMEKAIGALHDNGILIIREGDAENEKHGRTKTTELFSTRIFKFNKTEHKLVFLNRTRILEVAYKFGMRVEMINDSDVTSNTIFVLHK